MHISGSLPFDQDVILNGGYLYTTNAPLSSRLANERLTQAAINMTSLKKKSILDVGCGDGTYTFKLYKKCSPGKIVGIDSSRNAIRLAKVLYKENSRLQFSVENIYALHKKFSNFDLAILRGVIHHLDNPEKAILSVAKTAKRLIILEPNGYNPLLKIVEKISLYHRIHKEKSYFPFQIRNWLKKAKFNVVKDAYVGFVPFFCPEGMAITMKKIEPYLEKNYLFSRLFCAVYVTSAIKSR